MHQSPHPFGPERAAWRPRTKPGLLRLALWCAAFGWCLLSLSGQALGSGGTYPITLTWDANTEPDAAGYILRYGTATGVYTETINVVSPAPDVDNHINWDIPDLATESTIIYFVVSAYNSSDLEGPQSLETNTNPGDTTVTSIALSAGMVIPNLSGGTDAYVAFVPFSTAIIVLTPATQDGEAAVTVNGASVAPGGASGSIPVSGSTSTVITIVVTAKDGMTTRTITIDIIRLTAIETWRQLYFGSSANAGPGADSAIPHYDGITNLMKFATAMDPTGPGTLLATLGEGNGNFRYIYTRNVAAVSDGMIFTVEWSDTLDAESWSSAGVFETLVGQGDTELVTATVPSGGGRFRFVRLVITSP